MNTRHIVSLIVITVFGAFVGCKSSSTETPPTNSDYGGNTFPKSGSSYTYDLYQTDSTGAKVAGSDTTVIASVIASGLSYEGKQNVFEVNDNGSNNYFTYEHTGDLDLSMDTTGLSGSLGGTASIPIPQWITYFTSSKIKQDIQLFDSTISITIPQSPFPVGIEMKAVQGYLGDEVITVGGTALTCSKIHMKLSLIAIGTPLLTIEQTYWFNGSIGYFAKEQTTQSSFNFLGISLPGSGSVQTLTSYHLN